MTDEDIIESHYAALATEEDEYAAEMSVAHAEWWADHMTLEVEVKWAMEGESCPWCDASGVHRVGYSEWPVTVWQCGVCHRFMRQRSDDGEMCPSGNHRMEDGGCDQCTTGWRTHTQDLEGEG